MSKPKFNRPFNLIDAKAGAPIGCANGAGAEILRYLDRKMIGIQVTESGNQYASEWNLDGSYCTASHANAMDLVMLPLGAIDGKPVFVGDKLEQRDRHNEAWIQRDAQPDDRYTDTGEIRWAEPAKVYPKTQVDASHMVTLYEAVLNRRGSDGGRHAALYAVSNAALRHAIDVGQVITTEQANDEARSLAKSFSGVRSVRDMAIAQAVRRNCVAAYDREMTAHDGEEAVGNLNLAKIIASVK